MTAQTAVQLQGQRLLASVLLVKALGGVVKWPDRLMFPMELSLNTTE